MNIRPNLNRRQFLQTTALAASALPFMTPGAEPSSNAKGKIMVGCLSWCFHNLSPVVDGQLTGIVRLHTVQSELQFHGGLALKADSLAKVNERSDGVEQPAHAAANG